MEQESKELEIQINSLRRQMEGLPEGKLICARNGNHYKWYRSDGKRQVYIPKKERTLAEQLAIKKYLTVQLEALQKEKYAIGRYLRHSNALTDQAGEFLLRNSEYRELLSPYFKLLSQELLDWTNSSYEKNPKFPDQLIHKTIDGTMVRSKSEALIAMFLCNNQIPYRYECALQLGETTIYPEFTIRHPKTGKIFYWEHFGMMEKTSYAQNAVSKIQLYLSNNIIPTINLIATYETKENPLNADMIEQLIKYYFK